MGVSVELIYHDLRCQSLDAARRAAAIIAADKRIHPYHLQVAVANLLHPGPGICPCLEVVHFQGDHWRESDARQLWLAIAPFMADGACLEFTGEASERWRIRWSAGRVFEDLVHDVIWAERREITS